MIPGPSDLNTVRVHRYGPDVDTWQKVCSFLEYVEGPRMDRGQVGASSREIGFISRMAARCEVGGKSDGLVVLDLGGGIIKFHLDARVVFHFGFLVGLVNRGLGLAPGILDLP